MMRILLKNDYNSTFSTECSQRNIKRVECILEECCSLDNLVLERDIQVRLSGRSETIPYAISRFRGANPFFYIMVGFYLTTGSTQTGFVTKVSRLKQYIRENGQEASVIVVADGAGWVARRSDFDDLCDSADQVYTLNSLPAFSELINELK